jgi:hypothetical protein
METLEEILRHFEEHKDKYSASYDPETGKIISVGPSLAFQSAEYKIDLEKELAEDVLTGKIRIANCFLDVTTGSLEIIETRSIRKIDDVLHRIPLYDFVEDKSVDLFVTYTKKSKEIKFELSNELEGTKKTGSEKKRHIHWSGDTVMNFYLTKYNDPHWIFYEFDIKIQELRRKAKKFKLDAVPNKFSIFTRRILKNYTLEIK